jgi:hypothetical protein
MTRKEYIREYMREYRQGKTRKSKNDAVREQIKKERMNGDDVYTLAVRYNYRPESICRLCQNLPIKKHKNRHKLFYGYFARQRKSQS